MNELQLHRAAQMDAGSMWNESTKSCKITWSVNLLLTNLTRKSKQFIVLNIYIYVW